MGDDNTILQPKDVQKILLKVKRLLDSLEEERDCESTSIIEYFFL